MSDKVTEPDSPEPTSQDLAQVEKLQKAYASMKAEMRRVIVGQDQVIDELFMALFCRGHCLLLGVPGLAKTLMISTLSQVLSLSPWPLAVEPVKASMFFCIASVLETKSSTVFSLLDRFSPPL